MTQLVTPSTQYKTSYLQAEKEWQESWKDDPQKVGYNELIERKSEEDFQTFVDRLKGYKLGLALPKDFVASTELWLVDGDEYIGRVSIRHTLTPHLRDIGGHIGYAIRPSKRNQGYGTEGLKLALSIAKELDIKKVLITCDEDNIASRKIIESNGGVFEDSRPQDEEKHQKLRFWINI